MASNIKNQISKIKNNGWGWVAGAVLALIALAVFLRIYNLLAVPIFSDEAIYIRWAQVMRAEPTLRFLPLSDGKQPLFMWTVMPSLKVFSDPLIAGRMVSVFSGIATLVGIFLLSLRLFGSKTGALVAGLLYAVSPFSVFFDRMALVDSMLASFGIWTLYLGVLAAQTLRPDAAMLTGFSLGAAWLTKSPAIFFVILLPTVLLVSFWPKGKWARLRHFLKLTSLWSISWIIALVMYNIQRLGPNFHLISSRNQDYVFTFQEVLIHPLDPFKAHIIETVQWSWTLLPWTVVLLAGLGVLVLMQKSWQKVLLLLLWVVLPLFVQSEFAKVFTSRYILFTMPPLFILAGLAGAWIFSKFPKTHWLLIFFVAPSLAFNYLLLTNPEKVPLPEGEHSGYFEEWTAGGGIREVADFIKREHEADPEKHILVGTEGFFGTLPDGLQIYFDKVPNVTIKGVGISISSVDSSLVGAKKARDKVYLVVNSSRFEGEPDNLGLRLVEAYPKAERKFGSRGYVKHGPRDSLYLFEVLDGAINIFNVKNPEIN